MVSVPSNDQIESILNSIEAFKGALWPLESGIRKAAKDIECCWLDSKKRSSDIQLNAQFDDGGRRSKSQTVLLKKKNAQRLVGEEKKKGLQVKVSLETVMDMFFQNLGNGEGLVESIEAKRGKKARDANGDNDGSCGNCLQLAVHLFADSFARTIPFPFKSNKKRFQRQGDEVKPDMSSNSKVVSHGLKLKELKRKATTIVKNDNVAVKEEKDFEINPLEGFVHFMLDQLLLLQRFDQELQHEDDGKLNRFARFDHLKAVSSFREGQKADVNGLLRNLRFARVGGVPPGIVGGVSSVKDDGVSTGDKKESGADSSEPKLPSGILSVPLSNVERLRSTLSTISLTELTELVPQLGRPSEDHPDKKKLFSVQDFFKYTKSEGRRFFEELDRDGDGQVTLEDLEIAMRKRKLPKTHAQEFMRRARSHLFSRSFGWKQFLSLMEQREPTILRAYTSLCLSNSGTLQKSEISTLLTHAGLPANEDNADAMMRYLNADKEGSISYGNFRNFMLLLPPRLQDDPRNIWFEAATVVAVVPPVEVPAGSVLRSALAGGLSCAFSAFMMHPVDTIKTRVQASTTLSFPEILSKLPEIGLRGVYMGSIPAVVGQFSSHGLRTGIFEVSKAVLINVAPNLPDIQVQSAASFCGTFLGTVMRVPSEVLKQRLQAGLHGNVGEALVVTWQQDGLKGFFRGTGATLCRELPFYVAGMAVYEESKKLVQHLLGRELEPWETMAVGAISGGLTAVTTTPFDVIKTRMMTAPQGQTISMSMAVLSILRGEGPVGLFKGAVPRFLWIAPLGAINFAGYELLRKAMEPSSTPASSANELSAN